MIAADVRNRFVTEPQTRIIADCWNAVYPAMRGILDSVIKAQRRTDRPTVDVVNLERVRRELGQLDRGTFKACTRSSGAFSVFDALSHVREVLNVTSLGAPGAGAIYRLAGELADVVATVATARHAEWDRTAAMQLADGDRRDETSSESTERGVRQ